MPDRDLFGRPVSPNHGRPGRPRFIATAADRRRVRKLRRQGLSQAAIAAALGITIPTLTLNFAAQLGSRDNRGAQRARRDRKAKK